jgi:cell division septal protein FtsQ
MPKKKTTKARLKASSVRVKRSDNSSRGITARRFGRLILPLAISCGLLAALMFLGVMGFQTATASSFFALRNVDVRGTERTPSEDIRRIVAASVEKTGVWNADLSDIRTKLEKFPFVKAAAVSRMLPAGIRVSVTERVPAAVVHLSSGDFLIDGDGMVLTAATANDKNEKAFPFVLYGWDEAKTEKAGPDNLARLKLYRKMLDEWKQFDLASRVRDVNLSNVRAPSATIEDSGRPISVSLAKDNLGKSLKMAIEAVSGKGNRIKAVDAAGNYPVLQYVDF